MALDFDSVFNPKPVEVCLGKVKFQLLPLPIRKLQAAVRALDEAFKEMRRAFVEEGVEVDCAKMAQALSLALNAEVSEQLVEQATMTQLLYVQDKFLEVNGLGGD